MREIPLRNKPREIAAGALVDATDFDWLTQWSWSFHHGYASRRNRSSDGRIYMHRLILGLTRGDGRECDHINHDKLDNRRANLRVVTRAENLLNHPGFVGTSSYRGVSWCKRDAKWRAQIVVGGRAHSLGYYADETAAARAVAAFLVSRGLPVGAL